MNDQPQQSPAGADADALTEIARLLDEIRADTRWREEVAAAGAVTPPPPEPEPVPTPRPPIPGPALGEAVHALRAAIRAADAPVLIGAGTPLIGGAMAAFRRRVHAEIRVSQDRQTATNHALLATLERFAEHIDAGNAESPIGALWAAVGELVAALNDTRGQIAALEQALQRTTLELQETLETTLLELEPLGQLRVAVAELERRLAAPEGGS